MPTPPLSDPPVRIARGVCDQRYVAPSGRVYLVDGQLPITVLDRLNRLRTLTLESVCAGHHRGKGDRHAHVILTGKVRALSGLVVGLEALSLTVYEAHVARYGYQGAPERWHLEVRRQARGPAQVGWWIELAQILEEGEDA